MVISRAALTDRQNRIIQHIEQTGFATIEALAEAFGVSAQTIRRELIDLEAKDFLIRFHGGAGLAGNMFRLGYAEKRGAAQDGKAQIGAAIAAMIPDGASVYLDVGSTIERVAEALLARKHLRVVTPGAAVAMVFAPARHIDVFLTGGHLRGANGALVGEHAKETLRRFRFDYMVTSFGGFCPEGEPMDFDPEKSALRAIAMQQSLRRIGAVDRSKFHRHAMSRMEGQIRFTDLVTDGQPPEVILDALARAETQLHVVDAALGLKKAAKA